MYAKVFTQIYDGTLCTKGPWQALVTFQQLLVLADMDGNVDMTAGAIARRTTIPLEIIEAGIEALLQEDPESRTPTENGRRILPLAEGRPWGWKIVNYKHYRALKREEDRREYHREYWHKRKQSQPALNTTQQPQPNQPIAEADTEADIEPKGSVGRADALPRCDTQSIVDLYHEILPDLPGVRLMSDSRRKAIGSLWKFALTSRKTDGTRRATTGPEALEWIRGYFTRARDNDFLMGRSHKAVGHEGWQCDLDFLLTEKGKKHVIEKTVAA